MASIPGPPNWLNEQMAMLTEEQAFDAMVCFLTDISDHTNGSYPVAVILADCDRSWPDGDGVTTGNPAAWPKFRECVETVLNRDASGTAG